jgi:hypothetical protein
MSNSIQYDDLIFLEDGTVIGNGNLVSTDPDEAMKEALKLQTDWEADFPTLSISSYIYGGSRTFEANDSTEIYLSRKDVSDIITGIKDDETDRLTAIFGIDTTIMVKLQQSADMREILLDTLSEFLNIGERPELSNNEQYFKILIDTLPGTSFYTEGHTIVDTLETLQRTEDTPKGYAGVNIFDQITEFVPTTEEADAIVSIDDIDINDAESLVNFCKQNDLESLLDDDGTFSFEKLKQLDPEFIDFQQSQQIANGIVEEARKQLMEEDEYSEINKFTQALDVMEEHLLKALQVSNTMTNGVT